MTNVKKALSVLLAFVLVLGTCMFSAFAADTDTATIKVEAPATAKVGDVITVSVKLDANYAVASTSAIVNFNTADFELVAGSLKMNTTLFGSELATDAVAYEPQAGTVGAYFVAKKTAKYEAKAGVELFSFQLKALKDNANAALTLPEAELKSTTKPNGKIYCGKGDASDNIVEVPCTIALTNASVAIGGGAPAEKADLAKKAAAPAGLLIDTNITFGGKFAGVVYGFEGNIFKSDKHIVSNFEATNGGSLKITAGKVNASTGRPIAYSTDTTIEVLNADGSSTGKVYVVVIFGDANCDGLFNAADTTAVKNSGSTPNASPLRMAQNAQKHNAAAMMHTLNAADTTAEKAHVAKTKMIDQAAYAAHHSAQALETGAKQSKYV